MKGVRKALCATALLTGFLFAPSLAFAATQASAMTSQLLPVGANTCTQLTVTSVTPYIYDGELNSFDIVVPDPSYVAIGGSVGGEVIPFTYMTRASSTGGQLRVHTDVQSTPVGAALSVSVTMLSAKPGSPVCAATISFIIAPDGSAIPGTPTPTTGGTGGAGSSGGSAGRSTSGSNAGAQGGTSTGSLPGGSTTAPTSSTSSEDAAQGASWASICAGAGDYQLWFILLAIYVVITAIAALLQTPYVRQNPAVPVALILVPLILLVGFWYFVPDCRAGNWVPVVLLIIAIAGLLIAFRDQKGMPLLLPILPSKPQPPLSTTTTEAPQRPIVTPPPQQKK